MNVKHCSGCRNNFYNGNNDMGIKECWSLKSAKLTKRLLIPVDMPPPYTFPPRTVPDCYHVDRYVTVKPEAIDERGYWRVS
jgi:hypothetical protein